MSPVFLFPLAPILSHKNVYVHWDNLVLCFWCLFSYVTVAVIHCLGSATEFEFEFENLNLNRSDYKGNVFQYKKKKKISSFTKRFVLFKCVIYTVH